MNQLEEYNSCPGVVKMDLVLFKDAIEHVCRIVRVISQPRGNMLCVGIGEYNKPGLLTYFNEFFIVTILSGAKKTEKRSLLRLNDKR